MFIRNDINEATDDIFALFLKNHGDDFEKRENLINVKCEKCGSSSWDCKCKIGPTGPRGATGATGATGLRGLDGAIGATGPRGEDGAIGATGACGLDGEIGATGPRGENGAEGATGPRGPRGATGPQGLQGETGPTAINECGYFWNTTTPEKDIAAEEYIPFSDGAAHSPTINYDELTKEIIVENEGLYKVGFVVAAKETNQVTLLLNGSAVPGGTYGSSACDSINCGFVCLTIPAGARLALKNSFASREDGKIRLRESIDGASGKEQAVNASILIEKIG